MQDIACSSSGIILGIKLVKSKNVRDANSDANEIQHMGHGTKVLVDLTEPWSGKVRIVCADIYFASVEAAETLLRKKLRFIGVIKTATKRFPITNFGEKELAQKGEFHCLTSSLTCGSEKK